MKNARGVEPRRPINEEHEELGPQRRLSRSTVRLGLLLSMKASHKTHYYGFVQIDPTCDGRICAILFGTAAFFASDFRNAYKSLKLLVFAAGLARLS